MLHGHAWCPHSPGRWCLNDHTSQEASMPDLGSLFDRHVSLEFEAKDAIATMETMVDNGQ